MVLFVLHPGWIISTNDREKRWITGRELMKAYQVKDEECLIDQSGGSRSMLGRPPEYIEALMHLYPRSDSDYQSVRAFDRERIWKRLGTLDPEVIGVCTTGKSWDSATGPKDYSVHRLPKKE